MQELGCINSFLFVALLKLFLSCTSKGTIVLEFDSFNDMIFILNLNWTKQLDFVQTLSMDSMQYGWVMWDHCGRNSSWAQSSVWGHQQKTFPVYTVH